MLSRIGWVLYLTLVCNITLMVVQIIPVPEFDTNVYYAYTTI